MDRAGLAPASGQGRSQHQAQGKTGWKTSSSKVLGVFPSSSSLHGLEAPQTLQGAAERSQPLCVNLGTALPPRAGLPFLQTL